MHRVMFSLTYVFVWEVGYGNCGCMVWGEGWFVWGGWLVWGRGCDGERVVVYGRESVCIGVQEVL